jgi:hypothetical protein
VTHSIPQSRLDTEFYISTKCLVTIVQIVMYFLFIVSMI